jgi:plasmid stabilization system protein ParE
MGGQKKATSKAYQVRLSLNAIQNIDEITGYLAFINHQPLSAINVGNAFFETIDRIGTNPLAFRECQEIPSKTKMYRRTVCLSWIIVFKITDDEIIILGIIHTSRKPARLKIFKKIK